MPVLQDILVEELKDLLHAEGQLVKALPKMAKAARGPKLKQAYKKHTEETKGHVERLKQAFELLGEKPKAKPCRAMQGLVEEGHEQIEEGKDHEDVASDLLLITAAQKIEHYEISGYGTVRTMAEQLGLNKVAKLLSQTLAEEERTDKLLTQVSGPLLDAASHDEQEHEEEEEPARAPRKKRAASA